MKILNIVQSAYRATLEEQDDTVLWLSRVLKNNAADLNVLLRGNAVNYTINQECPTLRLGNSAINHPARPSQDVGQLSQSGAHVYAVIEDLEERGIDPTRCIGAIKLIRRQEIAGLMDEHDQVWQW